MLRVTRFCNGLLYPVLLLRFLGGCSSAGSLEEHRGVFSFLFDSFSFVLALYRANIVAVNAMLALHVAKTGRQTVGRTPLGLHVPSPFGFQV